MMTFHPLSRLSGSVEEFLIDGPMAVGQFSQGAENTGDGGRPTFENPTEGDLLEGSCGWLGEDITKLKNYTVPCRYRKCSVHADLLINGFLNTSIGWSASFLLVWRP